MRTEQFKNAGTPAARAVSELFREKNFLPGAATKKWPYQSHCNYDCRAEKGDFSSFSSLLRLCRTNKSHLIYSAVVIIIQWFQGVNTFFDILNLESAMLRFSSLFSLMLSIAPFRFSFLCEVIL
jgi:hypothetical protein